MIDLSQRSGWLPRWQCDRDGQTGEALNRVTGGVAASVRHTPVIPATARGLTRDQRERRGATLSTGALSGSTARKPGVRGRAPQAYERNMYGASRLDAWC